MRDQRDSLPASPPFSDTQIDLSLTANMGIFCPWPVNESHAWPERFMENPEIRALREEADAMGRRFILEGFFAIDAAGLALTPSFSKPKKFRQDLISSKRETDDRAVTAYAAHTSTRGRRAKVLAKVIKGDRYLDDHSVDLDFRQSAFELAMELHSTLNFRHENIQRAFYATVNPVSRKMKVYVKHNRPLKAIYKKDGGVDARSLKYIMHSLVRAAEYLEDRDMMNGRISPDSVVCTHEGEILMTDFSGCRFVPTGRKRFVKGIAVDGVNYDLPKAPLVDRNKRAIIYDHRDVFLIGMLAFYLRTGRWVMGEEYPHRVDFYRETGFADAALGFKLEGKKIYGSNWYKRLTKHGGVSFRKFIHAATTFNGPTARELRTYTDFVDPMSKEQVAMEAAHYSTSVTALFDLPYLGLERNEVYDKDPGRVPCVYALKFSFHINGRRVAYAAEVPSGKVESLYQVFYEMMHESPEFYVFEFDVPPLFYRAELLINDVCNNFDRAQTMPQTSSTLVELPLHVPSKTERRCIVTARMQTADDLYTFDLCDDDAAIFDNSGKTKP